MKSLTAYLLAGLCGLMTFTTTAEAQLPFNRPDVYQPLNHHAPPGTAGAWAGALGRADGCYFQPVQIKLAGGGDVTFYPAAGNGTEPMATPAQAGFLVGPLYRCKISNLPQYPGVELFPTFELVDRLHPPANMKQEYPIPVELSEADIEQAIQDQLVTKVIYIEQPDIAVAKAEGDTIREEEIPFAANLITEADLRGRPVLIFRIGGRIPSAHELSDPRSNPPIPIEFVKQK